MTTRSIPTLGAYVGPPESERSENPWEAACQGRTSSYQSVGGGYWLKSGRSVPGTPQLENERIIRVTRNVPRAVHMLASRPSARLTNDQLKLFTGAGPNSEGPNLHPYLVRSVGASDVAFVRWDGITLEVTGVAMGECPDLTNRPIVVLLERLPRQIFVNTVGAD